MITTHTRRIATSLCLLAAAVGAGILTNPDFESTGGWRVPADAGNACRIADDDGRSGQHCLRFRPEAPVVLAPVTQALRLTTERHAAVP